MWVYGSGFPKSHDVSKAIDKAAGAEREVIGPKFTADGRSKASEPSKGRSARNLHGGGINGHENDFKTAPATDAAKQWQGWGTALKPAYEPIIVARKPLVGTVAANVQQYGTGAINVDECRVGANGGTAKGNKPQGNGNGIYGAGLPGRWPANFIHDGSDEVVGLTGDAARFFYCAKASKADRDEGCEGLAARTKRILGGGITSGDHPETAPGGGERDARNHHPTVKPTDLMRYLCRLVTPPGGTVLDPFCGSGSTGKAAILEGFQFVGIEREDEYVAIAKARCSAAEMERSGESGKCYKRLHSGDDITGDLVTNHGNSSNIRAKLERIEQVQSNLVGRAQGGAR
jgi:site-specific DNA-methyltransferase (adenine-specific)